MNNISLGLLILVVFIIGVWTLIYTFKLGKLSSNKQQYQYDSETSETVKKHYILLNPVFLSYIIGFGFLLLLVFYFASKYR